MFPLSYLEIDSLVLSLTDIKNFDENPTYRKATPNMALAAIACNQLLEKHPQIVKSQIAFVLGTAFGEVEASLSFLKFQSEEGISRPNLFQNSLHNSTLGFVTIQLGLTGPAVSVSSGSATYSSTMLTAQTLLHLSDYAFGCIVDVVPENLQTYYIDVFPDVQSYIGKAHCWLWKRVT
jgi:3-oxoacyl-(acyl-carrier-protein) synthase